MSYQQRYNAQKKCCEIAFLYLRCQQKLIYNVVYVVLMTSQKNKGNGVLIVKKDNVKKIYQTHRVISIDYHKFEKKILFNKHIG